MEAVRGSGYVDCVHTDSLTRQVSGHTYMHSSQLHRQFGHVPRSSVRQMSRAYSRDSTDST
jgi:hypothetical protein